MNRLIPIFLLTLLCGCIDARTNTDFMQETKQRDFETNPSSFNISQLVLVCVDGNGHYCTKWAIQPK